MKKLFTAIGCGLLLSAGITANAATLDWGSIVSPEEYILYEIPSYYGMIKVTTNSSVDITADTYEGVTSSNVFNFIYCTVWGENDFDTAIEYTKMEVIDGNYVYYYNLTQKYPYADTTWDMKYALLYNEGGVQFIVTQDGDGPGDGPGDGGDTDPTPQIPEFTTDDNTFTAGPQAPKWAFDNSKGDDINEYYFKSNSSTNLSSYISFVRGEDGGINLPLTAVLDSEGNYVYIKASASDGGVRITDDIYYFTYSGSQEVDFTFIEGDYENYPEFVLGREFTASSSNTTYKMYNASLNGDYYIATNSTTDLMANPSKISLTTVTGTELLTNYNVEKIQNSTTGYYGYNFTFNDVSNTTLTFTYSGSGSVTFTIDEGKITESGAAQYMEDATYTPNTVNVTDLGVNIEISWAGQVVTIDNAEQTLGIAIDGMSTGTIIECKDYLQFKSGESGDPSTGLSTYAVTTGDSGTTLVLLMSGALSGNLEIGTYTFTLPAGLVKNADGFLNPKQDINVTVVGASSGVITPESGASFSAGENVEFVIEFEGNVVPNQSADDEPVVVTNEDSSFVQRYDWEAGVLYTENNKVVINLGNSLEADTYYLSFLAESVSVDGAFNQGIDDVIFTVEAAGADNLVEPTSVDPAEGTYANFSSTSVKIFWQGYNVTVADDSDDISVKLNGVDSDGWSWDFIDAEGEVIWEEQVGEVNAAGIAVQLPYGYNENGGSWSYNILIPQGYFNLASLTSDSVNKLNAEVDLTYGGIDFNDDNFIPTPAKGSAMKSLTTFTVQWDEENGYSGTLNQTLADKLTVGDWSDPASGGYASIADNGDNTFTVTLDQEYTTQGYVTVTFPEGLFTVTTPDGTVPSQAMTVTYNISVYRIEPANFEYLYEPLDSFTIYGNDSVELLGDVANIQLMVENDETGEYENYSVGDSYEAVSGDNGPGIKVTFAENTGSYTAARIIIPANTFALDGEAYNEKIEVDVYIMISEPVPAPTVTPENGSEVRSLSQIELSWNDSPIIEAWDWAESGQPFTLTITPAETEEAQDPININDCVSLVGEENFAGWMIYTSVLIKFDEPYINEGTYVINVPADYVEIENYESQPNTALTLTYYVGDSSAISSLVGAQDGGWVVYTLNGVKVLETTDANALSKLSKGIYVINGKKFIVR